MKTIKRLLKRAFYFYDMQSYEARIVIMLLILISWVALLSTFNNWYYGL